MTNVFVEDGRDNVTMRSKAVATLPKARAATTDYRGRPRRTPEGRRLADPIVSMRAPDYVPV